MSLEQLDAWLYTLAPAPRVNGTSMLDGYLTAIVIGPCSIPLDEWFADLLGESGRIATAAGAELAAIKAIVARFNAISEGLSLAPSKHAPIFEKTQAGLALPHSWCMGFLSAMRLRFDDWRPLLDLGRIEHGLLLPILLYCTDPLGRPMFGPPREGPETEEFLPEERDVVLCFAPYFPQSGIAEHLDAVAGRLVILVEEARPGDRTAFFQGREDMNRRQGGERQS